MPILKRDTLGRAIPACGQIHGAMRRVLYGTWHSMLERCYNPKKISFKWYGARGIKVCERWMKFENFLADMGEKPPGLSLDRINNDGNYEPSNCRWATMKQQLLNKRNHNQNTLKTRCKRGHPLSGDNVLPQNDGSRRCRACEPIRNARRIEQYLAAKGKPC